MQRDFSIFRPGSGLVGAFCAPLRRCFLPALTALAPVAGQLLGGMGGGGGAGGAAAAATPDAIDNTANFGAVNFGNKYIGDTAVKAAPAIITASDSSPSWTKFLPWIVVGVVGLFAVILIPFGARRR